MRPLLSEEEVAREVVASREGRLLCGLLISECGVLRCSLRDDPALSAFAEGERHVGLRVFELCWRAGEEFPLRCLREFEAWRAEVERLKEGADGE